MPSSNKTEVLELNQWLPTDKPKFADLNADNQKIDNFAKGILGSEINIPIIQNGTWRVWDAVSGAYVDTGVAATGPQGERGEQGPEGPQGPQGPQGRGLTILDQYDTLVDLETNVPDPEPGDAYAVGTATPYNIYIYGAVEGWVNHGPLQGPEGPQGDPGEPGEPGENAPQVEYEFSADGESWHSAYVPGDEYIHFSTDGGITFGDAIMFRGPQGPQGLPGTDGAPGPNEVTTDTSTTISGIIKGAFGKAAQAVRGEDYAKSDQFTVTLYAVDWVNGEITVENEKIYSATCPVIFDIDDGATTAQVEAFADALIAGESQASGSIVLKAHGGAPAIDLPIKVMIL